ncbi:MAG TPA: DUF4468 domain-containing protein [Daejeonella sp.]|nr:DUF4468 domain-containing protein [Daejeonella sp.]
MKKIVLVFLYILIGAFAYGQTAPKMLNEIEGKWKLDDKGNITFVRIVEAPGLKKEEIFNRSVNYFSYNSFSRRSEITTQDKENGIFVCRGLYENISGSAYTSSYIDAWHILRVDAKDGKARILITLTGYEKKDSGYTRLEAQNYPGIFPYKTVKIAEEYPVNLDGNNKSVMAKAFYNSIQQANNTLDAVEMAIKEGNTYKSIENSNW